MILAGDVGGTKTILGLFHARGQLPAAEVTETFAVRDFSGLDEVVALFLSRRPARIVSACFGIAGPVVRGICKATNLPWIVSERRLKTRFSWPRVRLVNDLAATVAALPYLGEEEFLDLNKGQALPNAVVGVIAPGTGLGMALGWRRGRMIEPMPSEGGHVGFAPRDSEEMDLLGYLLRDLPRVSTERLASGPGLVTIYRWLKDSGQYPEPSWLAARIESGDPAATISQAALDEKEPLAVRALDMFVSILGSAAGDLALTGMTLGGIYLGGGIPRKMLPKLTDGAFMKAFAAKGRFEGLLEKMPVRVILNEQAALIGAACSALLKRNPSGMRKIAR